MVQVVRLPPAAAIARFDEYADLLRLAVDRAEGRIAWTTVVHDIASGYSTIWLVEDAGRIHGVFSVAIHEDGLRWAEIELLAGHDFGAWVPGALAAFERWARDHAVRQIVFYGREGFARALKGMGFETRRIEGVKVLH